ncbi:ABC transporter substrate-binding protein [Acuticoccus sp.]|uniref:ABC transporter substrate-binding protein n=1 Tax=Acuticoccus sp. TaxID=1904378 RepID=UPI003B527C0E
MRQTLYAATALATLATIGAAQANDVQPGGTLNVITYYTRLDVTTWDYHKWTWKMNQDGPHLDHLLMGDVEAFGPRGSNESPFTAQDYIPREHLTGDLATAWELKEDPLRLEFALREDVVWPAKDGLMESRALVADDVVTTFEAMWESDRKIPTYWDFIERWEAEGDHKVVAYLDHYNANWPYRIGWGFYNAILPAEWHALSEEERSDWRNATGTGPYKVEEVVTGSRQIYVANDEYWGTTTIDGTEHELPLNDRLVYHIIKDDASAIATLRSGKADIMEQIRWQFVDELRRSAPDLTIEPYGAPNGTYLALRTDTPPFDNIEVRRAMNLAVNQEEILAAVMNGEGTLLNWPFAATWEGLYTPLEELPEETQALFGHDPGRAAEMLREAGVPEGFSFEVMVCTCNPTHMDMIPLLDFYFDQVGIDMQANAMEYGAFRSQMREDTMSAGYLMDNSAGNPFATLRKAFVSDQTWNATMHADPAFDALWEEANAEVDLEKQQELLKAANLAAIDAVAQVWLPSGTFYRAWWPWVKNYHGEMRVGAMRPGPIYARVWIDEVLKREMGY